MSRPIIGITTSDTNDSHKLNHTYITAIEMAGGLPVIVPMFNTPNAAQQFCKLLHGLVITGGPGITTGLVGTLPDDLPAVTFRRNRTDQLIYNTFADDTRPVLGICYGMQFINAQAGGQIYGDLHQHIQTDIQHRGSTHLVHIHPGTHMHRLFGAEIHANSIHRQALATVGDGLTVSATAPDGVIEAIESPDARLLGVQFHAERMREITSPLFTNFVNRCRRNHA